LGILPYGSPNIFAMKVLCLMARLPVDDAGRPNHPPAN
jgi:hypothetical protein